MNNVSRTRSGHLLSYLTLFSNSSASLLFVASLGIVTSFPLHGDIFPWKILHSYSCKRGSKPVSLGPFAEIGKIFENDSETQKRGLYGVIIQNISYGNKARTPLEAWAFTESLLFRKLVTVYSRSAPVL